MNQSHEINPPTCDAVTPTGINPQRFDTSVLLAIAAILIINSHLDGFYPRTWMAADGLLGVSIFYMLSGFGIQCSLLGRRQSFIPYFFRRLSRIYPALLIVTLVTTLLHGMPFTRHTPAELVDLFIWPTQYTYVIWIVPFYVAIYLVGRGATPQRYVWILAIMVLGYLFSAYREVAILTVPQRLQLGNLSMLNNTMNYGLSFFIGGALAVTAKHVNRSPPSLIAWTFAILLGIALYVAAKFMMVVYGHASDAFFVLHALVIFVCVAAFIVTTDRSFLRGFARIPVLSRFVALLSVLTWETYLIHQPLSSWPTLMQIRFPFNVAAIFILSMILSIPLHLITTGKLPWAGLGKNRTQSDHSKPAVD